MKPMMRLFRLVSGFLAVCTLSACESLDKITWSPDGLKVAVLADSSIKFGDSEGTLSQSAPIKAKLFRWLPDGKRALVIVEKTGCNWEEIKPLLSPEEIDKTVSIGEEVWNFHGSMAKLEESQRKKNASSDYIFPYLESKYGRPALLKKMDELESKIAQDDLKTLSSLSSIYSLQLITVEEDKIENGPVIMRSPSEITDLRVSPNGEMVLVSEDKGGQGCSLYLAFVNGNKPCFLESRTSKYPDWSADGSYAVFALSNRGSSEEGSTNGTIPLAMLMTEKIKYDHGLLQMSSGGELCKLAFSKDTRMRTLPDGNILFNAIETELPNASDLLDKSHLYEVSIKNHTPEKIKLKGDSLGDDLSHFELNKSGNKVAVADESGAVRVLDLNTDTVTTLEKGLAHADSPELKFNPAWRNEDELCFARRAGTSNFDVVLQSVAKQDSRVISSNWPIQEMKFLNPSAVNVSR